MFIWHIHIANQSDKSSTFGKNLNKVILIMQTIEQSKKSSYLCIMYYEKEYCEYRFYVLVIWFTNELFQKKYLLNTLAYCSRTYTA